MTLTDSESPPRQHPLAVQHNLSPSSSSNSSHSSGSSTSSNSNSNGAPRRSISSSSSSGSLSTLARVGNYELGRTLGEGTFAKVKMAKHIQTGHLYAIKIMDKEKILKHKMSEQIKREISTMKLVKHPNILQLYEVMASKTKVYFVLELATGGELLKKIKQKGKLTEDEARKYFQQLINAVDYCHTKGVYHRDLKPENLLLDADGKLKISDFGLSALKEQCWKDGLLHTACGTPNYVAPEVICNRGYDGAKADLWSCGVILFVLLTGSLPFEDPQLIQLYKKICKGEFTCPTWFSSGAQNLIRRILTPNVKHRITIAKILQDPWFKKGYKPEQFKFVEDVDLDDVDKLFSESKDHMVIEKKEVTKPKPAFLNAFELISFSNGLNLSGLFEMKQITDQDTRFTSNHPASEILQKMEEIAKPLGFAVNRHDYKLKLQNLRNGGKGHLVISAEVFEVGPSLYMVEIHKADGDTEEFNKYCHKFSAGLKDLVLQAEDVKS